MKRLHVAALLAGCATVAALSQAAAGGYARGVADTDLIYEEGNFNMRAGVTIVMPKRRYETLTPPPALVPLLGQNPVPATDGDYSQTYAIPSSAIKLNLADDLRCAGTYTQSFGADSEYGPQAIMFGIAADGTGTMREGFDTNEFGLTCGYKFDLSKGRAWLLGGGFLQDFSYSQTVRFAGAVPVFGGGTGTLKFDDEYRAGYRIGVAYEIPEIALRAQLLYRSAIDHSPGGGSGDTFTATTSDGSFSLVSPTTGVGTLPQSVEFKVQSGIAPGWLAFGLVRWMDWSVLDQLDYVILTGPFAGPRELEYAYKDGWTVTGGLGHAFSENISGVVGLTWDRGVSTTEDTLSDSYTAAAGVSLRDKLGGELRFGGALSYLTSASVSAESTQSIGIVDPGASFGYSVGGDWVYGLTLGYKIQW